MDNRSVLLVGAYERENFGDLLFGLITKSYLEPPMRVTMGAPFKASTAGLLGEDVLPMAALGEADTFGTIWTVGGEVGGVSLDYAYRMSMSDSEITRFDSLSRQKRAAQLESLTGVNRYSAAYLPRMSARSNTIESTYVVNSVGLRSIKRLGGTVREETFQALRESSFLSVRDSESHDILTAAGIKHVLAPDLVHTMRMTWEEERTRSDVALVQIREIDLLRLGIEQVAETLIRGESLRKFEIKLFVAGSARQHDNADLYRQLVEYVERRAPQRKISISAARGPFEKADEIASAGLWVGTSLHGAIVSTAYDVPHVGLDLDKVNRYASTWGEPMPFGVAWDQLDSAVDRALSLADSTEVRERSLILGRKAQDSVLAAAAVAQTINVEEDRGDLRRAADIAMRTHRQRPARRLADQADPWRHSARTSAKAVAGKLIRGK